MGISYSKMEYDMPKMELVVGKECDTLKERLDAVAPVPILKADNLEDGGSGAISDGTL